MGMLRCAAHTHTHTRTHTHAHTPLHWPQHDHQQELNPAASSKTAQNDCRTRFWERSQNTTRSPAAPFHLCNNGQISRSMFVLYSYIHMYIWLLFICFTIRPMLGPLRAHAWAHYGSTHGPTMGQQLPWHKHEIGRCQSNEKVIYIYIYL